MAPQRSKNKQTPSLFTPNPQQAAAIAHTEGPAAFIAAAGTGKTAILVQRLVRLIAEVGVAPEALLCVTFTRAAADEMEKRATKALRERGIPAKDLKGLRVVTFHGLGHQMLREKLQMKPLELNRRLLSGDPRQWLAEDIVRPWRSNRTRGMNWEVNIADVLGAVDRAKEELIKPEQSLDFFRRYLGIEYELAARYQEFFVRYEETKQKEKLYDLSDLIYIPLLLLESSPKFRKTWQNRYQYLQVDETQDTNPSQYKLIQYLASPKHNVVVVGDPDQAIYEFRGASPEASILSFKTMYPKGKIYRIEQNYRSTPQILEAANRLIAHNEVTPGFEKVLRPTKADGAPVMVTAYEDQESEAEGVAMRIEKLVRTWKEQLESLSYRDIFVLARTNHHLANLEIALARHRIPYRTLGGSSFFKRKTTRDILAYLTLIDGVRVYQEFLNSRNGPNPLKRDDVFTPVHCGEQNAAFRVVANIPSNQYFARTGKTSHRFTPTFFGSLTAFAGGQPLLQFCEEQAYTIASEHQLGVKDFVGLIRSVWSKCGNKPAEAIRLIREYAYDTHLRHYDSKHKENQDEDAETPTPREETRLEGRYDELEELTEIAQRHQSIRHFLHAMAQLKEQAENTSKNKRDCVSLMTVHKSKGLEAPAVFVMGLTEGIFPHRRSYTVVEEGPISPPGIAEERRLAYVALTRAQQLLFLSTITRYRGTDAVPSRFIAEAGLTPRDEDGVLNPFIMRRDGSPRKAPPPEVETPTLF
ncbi:ATP-dependent DNA helicase Rep/DNA helicase-2/ATP-dependent DNA helicase PcrA [Thermosporothrix hazakensis]|jgi:superfamily I DNA/RNA helicase|uniref:DNA 3'-5' helicase n=2 Tax=Thermosporothrix TaxID=768650 RepID=A0A326U1L0_THEHA|nr:ATP-dependent helicase [Thermosporothrix hazakensis]PZW24851.1 ATP-dependent DNA helicase Rep/DNA helicase-2/ATP-dependent DNA helicase PcrA [Thermosporothrix hazakensis]BBH88273.1 ATP-dependent DNA helicase Rep [Thermosporothrix sp. COM3]GCE46460.1 ATP-dependent DNA helicase Rep [Thermosporothrix hazakensis]